MQLKPSRSIIVVGVYLLLSLSLLTGIFLLNSTTKQTPLQTVQLDAAKPVTPQSELLSDTDKVRLLIEDVRASSRHRYGAVDDLGNGLDTIKVIQLKGTPVTYLGIYHYRINNQFRLKLAQSTDLINWKFLTDLEPDATHGDIMEFPEGDFLIAFEKTNGVQSFIKIRQYKSLADLKTATFLNEKDLPRSLSTSNEGTPNFISVNKKAFNKKAGTQDWSSSQIKLGLHYFTGTTDKNATGTLTNFTNWTAQENTTVNTYFTGRGYQGNYGDRDDFEYKTAVGTKKPYIIYEAQQQKDNWASWRSFLYDQSAGRFFELALYSHAGSTAIGNPTVTALTLPGGSAGYFVSYFIFSEGAAPNEGGQLIFYTSDANLSNTTPWDKRDISPTPTSAVTCTCNTIGGAAPNNGFTCTDGESRYCAADEYCTSSSIKPAYPCVKSQATVTPSPTGIVPSSVGPTNTPGSSVTCTCNSPGGTAPNNNFTCSDGYSGYCAANEACTSSSTRPAWPCAASQSQSSSSSSSQSVTCTCNTPGGSAPNNGFICSDGYSAYCAANEYCTSSATRPAWPCATQ